MAKAIGIGGVFLKAGNSKELAAWYATHLGVAAGDDGSLVFDGPESAGMTVFAHFPSDTEVLWGRTTARDGQFQSG